VKHHGNLIVHLFFVEKREKLGTHTKATKILTGLHLIFLL
jgi:hypothetical protein